MNNDPLQSAQRQLRELLSRLPDAPLASNFTARVLQSIEAEEMRRSRWGIMNWDWNWRILFPRITVTAAAAGIVDQLPGFLPWRILESGSAGLGLDRLAGLAVGR